QNRLNRNISILKKQTQVERQKIVAEFQQLRQFLEEQERLLLAQLQKMDEEIVRLQTDTVTKLSAQISRLSQVIGELEGKCQKPGSEFLQGVRCTLRGCEKGQAQRPEEMAPELEERVRGFSQKVIVLLETLREFKGMWHFKSKVPVGNISLMTSARLARLKLSQSPSIRCGKGENTRQPLPDTPERFDTSPCVLGREGFTLGRHYWEAEVGDGRYWAVGVARESVSRKGGISLSPKGGIWAVGWCGGQFQALTDPENPLPLRPPSRIRVCLDCDRGQVTFIVAGTEAQIFTF
uniref:B30.2/SPRY domain-containing protein n=1 Tax=Pelodiscus sinensis TaxID=13735 RepID=K7FP79_PELSI